MVSEDKKREHCLEVGQDCPTHIVRVSFFYIIFAKHILILNGIWKIQIIISRIF